MLWEGRTSNLIILKRPTPPRIGLSGFLELSLGIIGINNNKAINRDGVMFTPKNNAQFVPNT